MGNYHAAFEVLLQRLFKGAEVLVPPPVTAKTLEVGSLHSPDFVCVPFKYTLGNIIEAVEKGANVVIQAGCARECRVSYYAELQTKILKDLGYKCTVVDPFPGLRFNPLRTLKVLRQAGANASLISSANTALAVIRMIKVMDKIDTYIRANEGFEVEPESFSQLNAQFISELKTAKTIFGVNKIYKKYFKKFRAIKLNKPEKPMRVLIIGEVYVLMEPYSNYFMEKQLAKFNIEVRRDITLTHLMTVNQKIRDKHVKYAGKYLKYDICADGLTSVSTSLEVAEQGYDGIIHLKPFGCLPEVSAMPMLNNIARDKGIPVLFFSFDSQTSETGVKTRLEAFYDMLCMKRERSGV